MLLLDASWGRGLSPGGSPEKPRVRPKHPWASEARPGGTRCPGPWEEAAGCPGSHPDPGYGLCGCHPASGDGSAPLGTAVEGCGSGAYPSPLGDPQRSPSTYLPLALVNISDWWVMHPRFLKLGLSGYRQRTGP